MIRSKSLFYIIGAPGAGKTTLVDTALKGYSRKIARKPFAHQILSEPGLVLLGDHKPPFSGTDTLSMGVLPVVEAWLAGSPYNRIIGEGDRLANERFLLSAKAAGYDVVLINITASDAQLERRRQARAYLHGLKLQNQSWAAGRATKAENLARRFGAIVIVNDDLEQAATQLARLMDLR